MSFYRLEVPVKGILYPAGNQLPDKELVCYRRKIQYMLRSLRQTQKMPDNGRIFVSFPEGILKRKILASDLNVYAEAGQVYGAIEIETTDPMTSEEESKICDYLQQQFSKGWGNWFHQKPIPIGDKTLVISFQEPSAYVFTKKKYEITDIAHPKYPWLHRIRALVHVGDVARGDLGGYVESEENLSQGGHCWIYDDAIACECAAVIEEGCLLNASVARDNAVICGDAMLFDKASAEDYSCLLNGVVKDAARIAGNAVIKAADNREAPVIRGNSNIYGTVCGRFYINDIVLPREKLINPTEDMIVLENGKRDVLVKQRKLKSPEQRKNKENREYTHQTRGMGER